MDRYQRWHYGSVASQRLNDDGQATVEFALITVAFLALCAGIASLWRGVSGGAFSTHVLMAASHHAQLTLPGGLADIFLY